jgi:hypothetical protein
MPTVTVDRLSLRLSGLTESDGRHLARLIAEGLASASIDASVVDHNDMQSGLTVRPGSDVQGMAEEVVADLIRQLQRSA